MLKPVIESDPHVDTRVLLLTDGKSNAGMGWQDAARAALTVGVIVDAIIVGDRPDPDVRKIVAATGGLCFQVSSLSDGFELLERVDVVSLRERRGGADKEPHAHASVDGIENALQSVQMPAVMLSSAAPIWIAAAAPRDVPAKIVPTSMAASTHLHCLGGGALKKRILKELADAAFARPGVHVFLDTNDCSAWHALLEDPKGGTFLVQVGLPGYRATIPSSRCTCAS
jgi:hypothetical protein